MKHDADPRLERKIDEDRMGFRADPCLTTAMLVSGRSARGGGLGPASGRTEAILGSKSKTPYDDGDREVKSKNTKLRIPESVHRIEGSPDAA